MMLFTIFVVLIFLYSLVSARLERTVLTAPILFTAAGMMVLGFLPELRERKPNLSVFLSLAEAGLVLLLFTDASRTNLNILKSIRALPVRLLSTGMLLTIFLGAVAALVALPQLSIWEAGVLSAILAPTDAGLGQIIVNSPRVPQRIRQALNVEAGLNDGLSVPFLLFFIGLAAIHQEGHQAGILRLMAEQLGLGTLIGAACGLVGGWLLGIAHRREWPSASFEQLGVVAVPLICALACKPAGASVFIGAFVAGLAVQVGFPEAGRHSVEFTEEWGQVFNLCVFFLFGIITAKNWGQFNLPLLAYALLSLTVVRMFPVAVALIGTRLSRATVAFMGWFGPRGLASIVLGLVFLEEEPHLAGERTITLAVILTVWLSIFAHGLSAIPGMNWYANRVASLSPDSAELMELAPAVSGTVGHTS